MALSNPVMQMELPGVQGKPRTALGYLLHALRDALTLCQTEGAWVHLQPSTGLGLTADASRTDAESRFRGMIRGLC